MPAFNWNSKAARPMTRPMIGSHHARASADRTPASTVSGRGSLDLVALSSSSLSAAAPVLDPIPSKADGTSDLRWLRRLTESCRSKEMHPSYEPSAHESHPSAQLEDIGSCAPSVDFGSTGLFYDPEHASESPPLPEPKESAWHSSELPSVLALQHSGHHRVDSDSVHYQGHNCSEAMRSSWIDMMSMNDDSFSLPSNIATPLHLSGHRSGGTGFMSQEFRPDREMQLTPMSMTTTRHCPVDMPASTMRDSHASFDAHVRDVGLESLYESLRPPLWVGSLDDVRSDSAYRGESRSPVHSTYHATASGHHSASHSYLPHSLANHENTPLARHANIGIDQFGLSYSDPAQAQHTASPWSSTGLCLPSVAHMQTMQRDQQAAGQQVPVLWEAKRPLGDLQAGCACKYARPDGVDFSAHNAGNGAAPRSRSASQGGHAPAREDSSVTTSEEDGLNGGTAAASDNQTKAPQEQGRMTPSLQASDETKVSTEYIIETQYGTFIPSSASSADSSKHGEPVCFDADDSCRAQQGADLGASSTVAATTTMLEPPSFCSTRTQTAVLTTTSRGVQTDAPFRLRSGQAAGVRHQATAEYKRRRALKLIRKAVACKTRPYPEAPLERSIFLARAEMLA